MSALLTSAAVVIGLVFLVVVLFAVRYILDDRDRYKGGFERVYKQRLEDRQLLREVLHVVWIDEKCGGIAPPPLIANFILPPVAARILL